MKVTFKKLTKDKIYFTNNVVMYDVHHDDCCESHYLDFSNLDEKDFKGMEFEIDEKGEFFKKVKDYGIRLKPLNGHEIPIPGYGSNNGYYSSNLYLNLDKDGKHWLYFDISECQDIDWD